jgi:superfamily II DNA/RNA helicase
MYDDSTKHLIDAAYKVSALRDEDIGKLLTEAHAKLASARLMGTTFDSTTHPRHVDLTRLADTLEAIAVTGNIQTELKQSCAFVSASCRGLLCQRLEPPKTALDALNRRSVSGEVRACLLFLISGQIPDAAESLKRLPKMTDRSPESALLTSLSLIVDGNFKDLKFIEIPNIESGDLIDIAANQLMIHLVKSARDFATIGLSTLRPSIASVISAVKKIRDESRYELDAGGMRVSLSFPGIFHLSSLFQSAFESLHQQLLVNVERPSDIQDDAWAKYIARRALVRPYVWPNHREAISKGYLEKGTSAVVTFPTGAGKTTVIDLKIAAALERGELVLIFAPTLALVDQTFEHLNSQFPGKVEKNTSQQPVRPYEEETSKVFVLTPEKYLASSVFIDGEYEVGLVVFDEFHLVHPTKGDGLRRNLDAMMSIVDIVRKGGSTDFLLVSAMVSNGIEIASWLSFNGKNCINLDGRWKPTRQIRGCLVYDGERINELEREIRSRKSTAKRIRGRNAGPRSSDKKSLTSQPHALFCLTQAWHTHDESDYTLLPVTPDSVDLALSKWWRLTPNKNAVSGLLAKNLALSGTKTVVFASDYVSANSIAESCVDNDIDGVGTLSAGEAELLEFAKDDIGDQDNVFAPYGGFSCQHHSSMLNSERRLSEEIFRRRDGAMVLVATSTLAQGLNLPAEAVILVGDMRYDSQDHEFSDLEAHELLNAAGRAGRAGFSSHGLVLIVPSDVATFERKDDSLVLHPKWFDLQKRVFSNPDQCLKVDDPIQTVIDMMHTDVGRDERLITYFLHRIMAFDEVSANEIFSKSLSGFRARDGAGSEYAPKVKNAIEMSKEIGAKSDALWVRKVSADSGVSIDLIELLRAEIAGVDLSNKAVLDWVRWFFEFCRKYPDAILGELRQKPIVDVWKHLLPKLSDDSTQLSTAFPAILSQIEKALCDWMIGKTLTEIELSIGRSNRRFCPDARKVVGTIAYDFSYLFGVAVQTCVVMREVAELAVDVPLSLATAPNCLREGVDAPELLAMKILAEKPYSRKVLREKWNENMNLVGEDNSNLEFGALIRKIRGLALV